MPFAATKIQPPRQRRARLARGALEAALAVALGHARVVLLHAPAGYGKTSLLAALPGLLPPGTPLAWVSLDEDDDEQRFFACLSAALEAHDLPWRIAPEALAGQLGHADDAAGRALTELVHALAGAEVAQGLIVLDDVHRVAGSRVPALLEELIDRLPAHWTVLLASRVLPPLPLARWRAAGELQLFDQERLAFSADEVAALAAVDGAAARAAELYERTRGWPAGLRLLLAAPAGSAASRTLDREVFDFIAAEVLDEMPVALHDFLLRVAVLPELTVARAAAVSGDARAAERFDEIERRGLFATVLEAEERTLVLHDLFREALLDRLRRRWPQQEVALLRRAADGEADPVRRVGFLLRAGDWLAAEAALAAAAPALLLAGSARELLRLVDAFDPAWREHSPRLQRLAGMACVLRWDWEPMAAHLRAAAEAARRLGDRDEQDLAEAHLAGALYPLDQNAEGEALIAALLARRSPPVAPAARRQALMADCSQRLRRGEMAALPGRYAELLDLLEASDDLFEWWQCVPPFNWTTVPGMDVLIERYVQGALTRIGGRPLPLRAEVKLLRVFGALWQGRLDAAALEADGVEADHRWLACSGELELGLAIYRLIAAAVHGRAGEVQDRLQALFGREDGAGPERQRLWHHHMAIYGLRMSDTLGGEGRAAALEHWAASLKEDPLRSAQFDNHRAIGVRARHAAAQGRWADAAAGFARLLPLLSGLDVMGHAMDLRLRAAHALLQAGRAEEAQAALRPALQRLLQEGQRGQALLAGPAVLAELAAARWPAPLADELQQELQAAAALAAVLRTPPSSAAAGPAVVGDDDRPGDADDLLSAREREVLALMAAGDSNKHIARALDISPHTVKRHVANILDKLGLASRGQAAAWYRNQA
ncbi:MAG: LuxR C-terminal-related transcriptional regulator [Rubrivivax sp.]